MLHPTLSAFYESNHTTFPDLKITKYGDHLMLMWEDSDDFHDEITAFMFGDRDEISFEIDDVCSATGADPLSEAADAFAHRLMQNEDDGDEFDDVGIEPGTFGALVWLARHRMRRAEIDEEIAQIEASIARLAPTTITDLPLFRG